MFYLWKFFGLSCLKFYFKQDNACMSQMNERKLYNSIKRALEIEENEKLNPSHMMIVE